MATKSNSSDIACSHCPAVERLLDEIETLEDLVETFNDSPDNHNSSDEFLVAYA